MDGWMNELMGRQVGIDMNMIHKIYCMHFFLINIKHQLIFHWQDYHHDSATYTMLDHSDALRGVKWERLPAWSHAFCCGIGVCHSKGKGPWNSYLLHKHNISGSGSFFVHFLFRLILSSPLYTKGNWNPERLRDLPSVSQLLRWQRQDCLEYRVGCLQSVLHSLCPPMCCLLWLVRLVNEKFWMANVFDSLKGQCISPCCDHFSNRYSKI